MSPWLWAALFLIFCLVPCGINCLRGSTMHRLIALQMATIVHTILFLVLAEAFGNSFFFDVSLTLAVLSLSGGLVFLRYLEKWI